MQEINRLLLMPSLDALSPEVWGSCAPSVQLFVACAFAASGTTFVLLPWARRLCERTGFLHSSGGSLRHASAALLLTYAALLGAGLTASALVQECGWHVERLGKLTPMRAPPQ